MPINKKSKKKYRSYIVFSSMAIQMGVMIAIFVYIGMWLDKKFPNNYQLFTIIFALIGVFGALYSSIKQVINFSKKQDED
ncbi:MAG: hypothetical protein CR968_01485 [Flavobacteriia bacterium]|nr:MAG: hypothetical protein CR968_01485 [Flavobacteriia bacterium]